MESIVQILLNLISLYLVAGGIFSILFLWKGILQVDKGAAGTSKKFKLLLFPGLLIFWPIFLNRWYKAK